MHGGEPMLSSIEQHQNLLDHYIQTGQAKNISIHYTTNATIFPDQNWLSRWKNFAEIDLQLSIDGIGNRYEYLRYPADWSTLNKCADQYLKLQQQESNIKSSQRNPRKPQRSPRDPKRLQETPKSSRNTPRSPRNPQEPKSPKKPQEAADPGGPREPQEAPRSPPETKRGPIWIRIWIIYGFLM